MSISDICIKRPVFTWVLVAIPVVLGIVSYGRLGVDLFPNVDFPVCTITTVLQGAGVEEMETSVTKPIEDVINTVSGIEELRSTTSEGISTVMTDQIGSPLSRMLNPTGSRDADQARLSAAKA